jgi:S1-C subfamily serine protease
MLLRKFIMAALLLILGLNLFILNLSVEVPDVQRVHGLPKYGSFSNEPKKFNPLVRINISGAFCSGTIIDDNYLLTAAHCVSDVDHRLQKDVPVYVFSDTGENTRIIGTPVFSVASQDVALIKGNFTQFKYALVDLYGRFPVQAGNEPYLSFGFPAGQKEASQVYLFPRGNYLFMYLMVGGTILKGMSGGPVINRRSIVVGVNSAVTENSVLIGPVIGILTLAGIE